MVNNSKTTGFTLIELLVTIAILSVLLILAVPLTTSWSDDAQVQRAKSTLERGYQQAKAIALRNPTGQTNNSTAASSIVISNGILLVCQGVASDCSASTAKWQEALPGKTHIVTGSTCSTNATLAIGINSRGMRGDTTTYKACQGETYATAEL